MHMLKIGARNLKEDGIKIIPLCDIKIVMAHKQMESSISNFVILNVFSLKDSHHAIVSVLRTSSTSASCFLYLNPVHSR